MTCCFFSSFKTLLTSPRVSPSGRNQRPGLRFIVGRFSGDHQWPVLGDHRGLSSAEMQTIREACRYDASDGHLELFKTTKKYDGDLGRKMHGFPSSLELPV